MASRNQDEVIKQIANQTNKELWSNAAIRAVIFLAIFMVFDFFTKRNIFSEDYKGSVVVMIMQLLIWYAGIVLLAYLFARIERRIAAKKLEKLNNDR